MAPGLCKRKKLKWNHHRRHDIQRLDRHLAVREIIALGARVHSVPLPIEKFRDGLNADGEAVQVFAKSKASRAR